MPPNTPKFRSSSSAMIFGDFNTRDVEQIQRRSNDGAAVVANKFVWERRHPAGRVEAEFAGRMPRSRGLMGHVS